MAEATQDDPNVNEWDEYAAEWDDDEAARAYAAAAFLSLCDALVPLQFSLAGASVIDFGCGTGLLTERLVAAGAEVSAVDTSASMLEVLDKKIFDHEWAVVSTHSTLPRAKEAFDLVVCSSVCGFLDDYPAMVMELVGRLRPGGVFVQWDWEQVEGESHGLSRTAIGDALSGAGLANIRVDVGFEVEAYEQTMRPLMGVGVCQPRGTA